MTTRRELLQFGLLSTLGLAGCVPPTLRLARDTVLSSKPRTNAYGVDEEFLAKLPYAVMGIQLDEHSRFIAVLATVENGRYTWATADSRILVTQGGYLVETRGFERDLTAVHWLDEAPLAAPAGLAREPHIYREVDLVAGRRHETALPVESRFRLLGEEVIAIRGQQRSTVKVAETARFRRWRWEADNLYWVDVGNGVVLRSSQSYCPEVGILQLELLKPPTV